MTYTQEQADLIDKSFNKCFEALNVFDNEIQASVKLFCTRVTSILGIWLSDIAKQSNEITPKEFMAKMQEIVLIEALKLTKKGDKSGKNN